MSQKDKKKFKEYTQRWRELVAQISPTFEEKEMTKIFLITLSPFYYEHMISSASNDFTGMVSMGIRLDRVSERVLCLRRCLRARSMVVVSPRRRREKPMQFL